MAPVPPLPAAAAGLLLGLLLGATPLAAGLLPLALLTAAALPGARASALALALGLLLDPAGSAPASGAPAPGPRVLQLRGEVEEAEPWHAGAQRFVLAVRAPAFDPTRPPFQARVGVRWQGAAAPGVAPGERVDALLRIEAPRAPRNPGERDARTWSWRQGIELLGQAEGAHAIASRSASGSFAGALHDLRSRTANLLSRRLAGQDGGLARALLLGDRSALARSDAQRFREAGQGHIVAVSGQHVVLVVGALLLLTRAVGLGLRSRLLLGLVTLLVYVPLSGAAPSAVRSGLGAGLWLLARLLGRRGAPLDLVAGVAWAMLVVEPGGILDPGFTLSFAAVLGIARLAPRLLAGIAAPQPRIPGLLEPRPPRLRQALCVATAAWLAGAPLALHAFGQLAPAAVPFSLLTVPLATVLLALASLVLALGGVPLLGGALAWAFAVTADGLRHVLGWARTLGLEALDATPPGDLWLVVALGALVVAAEGPRRLLRWSLLLVGTLLLGALAPLRSPAPQLPCAWALDVGRSPAVVLRLPDGRDVLLGAGSLAEGDPARWAVLPALRALGVTTLDLAWCSEAAGPRRQALDDVVGVLGARRVVAPDGSEGTRTLLQGPWGRLLEEREGPRGTPRGAVRVRLQTPHGVADLIPAPLVPGEGARTRALGPGEPDWRTAVPAPAAAARRYLAPRMLAPAPPDPLALACFVGALALFARLCVRPLDWLRPGGAWGAFALGTACTASLGWAAFAALLAPFVVATALGRLPGRPRERGRSLAQVAANGLPALLGALVALLGAREAGAALLVGGLACLGADTCATEIGTRYGGTPRAIWGARRLAPGESGGVTLAGLVASLLGALLAPLAYGALAGLTPASVLLLATAGFAGSIFDSLLGATLQWRGRDPATGLVTERRRIDGVATVRVSGLAWLDNDAVNLVSGLCAAALAWALA